MLVRPEKGQTAWPSRRLVSAQKERSANRHRSAASRAAPPELPVPSGQRPKPKAAAQGRFRSHRETSFRLTTGEEARDVLRRAPVGLRFHARVRRLAPEVDWQRSRRRSDARKAPLPLTAVSAGARSPPLSRETAAPAHCSLC